MGGHPTSWLVHALVKAVGVRTVLMCAPAAPCTASVPAQHAPGLHTWLSLQPTSEQSELK